MPSETEHSNPESEASYRGARDGMYSFFRDTVFAVLLLCVGLIGVGLISAAAIPVLEGTATRTAFPGATVGLLSVTFAAYELYTL